MTNTNTTSFASADLTRLEDGASETIRVSVSHDATLEACDVDDLLIEAVEARQAELGAFDYEWDLELYDVKFGAKA